MSYDIGLGFALRSPILHQMVRHRQRLTLQEVPTGVTKLHMGMDFALSLWTLIFAKQMGRVSTH